MLGACTHLLCAPKSLCFLLTPRPPPKQLHFSVAFNCLCSQPSPFLLPCVPTVPLVKAQLSLVPSKPQPPETSHVETLLMTAPVGEMGALWCPDCYRSRGSVCLGHTFHACCHFLSFSSFPELKVVVQFLSFHREDGAGVGGTLVWSQPQVQVTFIKASAAGLWVIRDLPPSCLLGTSCLCPQAVPSSPGLLLPPAFAAVLPLSGRTFLHISLHGSLSPLCHP